MGSNRIKIIILTCFNCFFFNLYGDVRDTLKKEKFTVSVGTGYSIGLIDKLNDKRIKYYNNELLPYRGDIGLNIFLKYKKILFGIDIFHYSLFKYENTDYKSCIYNFCNTISGKFINKDGNSTGLFFKKYRISIGSVLMEKRNYQAGWLIGFNSRTYGDGGILIDINGYKEGYFLDFHYFFTLWINFKIPTYERINLTLKYECLFAKVDLSRKYGDSYYKGIYLFNNIGFSLTYKVIMKHKYEKKT